MPAEGTPSIQDIESQIDTILGSGAVNGDGTQKPASFRTQYGRIKEANPEAVEGVEPLVKKVLRAERKLAKEIGEKEEIPSHNEISGVYDKSVQRDRLKLGMALIQRAFEANGKTKPNPGGEFPELRLDHVEELKPQDIDAGGWDRIRVAEGEPKIFFTQIYEEKQVLIPFRKETKNTGQVLVVMSMNNGRTPSENTVVTMLVRHDGGKLLWGLSNSGIYRVQSEEEYRQKCAEGAQPTADSLLSRGEVTIEKYKMQFAKEHRKSLDKFWVDEDAKLTKPPSKEDAHAGEILEERRLTDAKRKELLEGLTEQYTKRLQELRKAEAQIIELTQARVAEIEARNAQILGGEDFRDLIALLIGKMRAKNVRGMDSPEITIIKRSITRLHGVDPGYLDNLILREVGANTQS